MKQFSLEEYLKNPSRKVVTRDGSKVRIICTDKKGDCPIVALVTRYDGDAEETIIYTKMVSFLRTPHINMTSSLLLKSTKAGLISISQKCIDVESYIIPKKKPDSIEAVQHQ